MASSDNGDKYASDLTPRIKTPAAGPRPKAGKMDDTELQSLMDGLVASARQYIQLDLTPIRTKATKYYKGEPFGNEQKGRSQFISTEVHDSVQAILPAILRMVFGPERPVEFRARRPDAVDGAAQATDYVQYVFEEENDGFMQTRAVLMDGLIRRHGIWKWGWDETPDICHEQFVGSQDDFATLLATSEGTKPTSVTDNKDGTITAEYTREYPAGKPWICAVPPEELIAVRESRSLTDTVFVGHQTRKTTGELIEMGVSKKFIEEHGGDDPHLRDDELALERTPNSGTGGDTEAGEANDRHLYVEGYARIDYDGDGVPELRRVCLLGPGFTVIDGDKFNTPVDDLPLAVWCPDPEPHTLLGGRSWADRIMDMQRLESQLMRAMLDSASSAIYTRKLYKEGDANLADLLSTQIGAPIRSRSGQGAVTEFAHSFMGKELLPVLEMTRDIVERKTGISRGATTLDADALQSSTKTAVAAQLTAAQAQQEMLVRIFSEGSLKPMFKGVLRMFAKYKPQVRTVKLRGEWVPVNPSSWDPMMDVSVNVCLGAGMIEEKLQTLFDIKTTQEQILQTMSPQNPIVTLKQYRDTLAQMAELRGFKDSSRYFQVITDAQIQQMAQAAASAPPPPSPEMEMAKAKIQIAQSTAQAKAQQEQMKVQATAQLETMKAKLAADLDAQKAQHEIKRELAEAEIAAQLEARKLEHDTQLEAQKIDLEMHVAMLLDSRERDKTAADIQLKIVELELQYQTDLSELEITSQIERDKMALQAGTAAANMDSAERMHSEKMAVTERTAGAKNDTAAEVAAGKNQTTEKVAAKKVGAVKGPKVPRAKKKTFTVQRGPDNKITGGTIEETE